MAPAEVAALLVGKVVAEIKYHRYLGWDMCVDQIIFSDGTIIDVGGNADYGRFDEITTPAGEWLQIYNEDD